MFTIHEIQTSNRMQYFTIFQEILHSVNIQDDQSWAFSETDQKCPKSPILIELRFNIIFKDHCLKS